MLLTGHRHELTEELQKTSLHGVDLFFYKPLDMEAFLGTLQHWVTRLV